jgi:hypothetical protein
MGLYKNKFINLSSMGLLPSLARAMTWGEKKKETEFT